ncbi:hypothetical protein DNTS_033844 [Danionella cerebrum]|uniref:aspartate transaminase n=1 Tax=Danionella cerebrum TaxID=2873325 RepID=A0A553N5D4_9TELE|nr:hypothetical protein DNTS_033844 [Danionella translucida]
MSCCSVFDGAVFVSSRLKVLEDFKRDTHPDKVNLAGREYVGEQGHTTWLPIVQKIKLQVANDPTLTPEYPLILGNPEFSRRAAELALGKDCPAIVESRSFLHIPDHAWKTSPDLESVVDEVMRQEEKTLHAKALIVAKQGKLTSWECLEKKKLIQHSLKDIFKAAGINDVQQYHYWDPESKGVCLENMVQDLEDAPMRSVIVLSVSGHCPTGVELSQEEWKRVADVMGV